MTETECNALLQILDHVESESSRIFIRTRVNGIVGNYALSDLPLPLALHYACRFIRGAVQSMLTDSAGWPAPDQTSMEGGQTE